ncbi:MAG: Lrp/AsnC family transcriptional regulator [Thermoplasmatales archaeon]|nr:MAG: Lrp/AsnC family transcriptional regulator [Thermoplasmatales archaeon]
MPKRSKKQINEDEKRVIEELQKNSSNSIEKLAKNCGFSRQKIWRIKKRLEKNKTIWGYHAIVDNEKLNVNRYIMLVKLIHLPIDNSVEKTMVERTIDKLGAKIGVSVKDSFWLHGNYDYMVSFFAENLKKAKNFQEIFMRTNIGNILELQLLENICTIEKDGFVNPKVIETKKLL